MKNRVHVALVVSLAVYSSIFGWGCWDKAPEVVEVVDDATKITLAQELFDKMYAHQDVAVNSYVQKGVDIKDWRDESGLSLADAELVYDRGSRSMQQAGSPLTAKGLEYIVNHLLVSSVSGNLSNVDRAACQRLIQEYKTAGIGLTIDPSQMDQVQQIQILAEARCNNSKNICYVGTDMPNPCNTKKDLKFIMANAINATAAVAALNIKK